MWRVEVRASGTSGRSRAKRRDSRVLGAVRSYPLAAFFVLAIGLSWSYWIPDVLVGGHWSHFPG